MTEVRIRHEYDARGVSLGDVPLLDLDRVIPLIRSWGVNYDYNSDVLTQDLSGQFIISDGAAFFEVLIGAEDSPS